MLWWLRLQVKQQKGITTMNTTNHNIVTLNEAELNEVHGGLVLSTIVAGAAVAGSIAILAKTCVDLYKTVKSNKNEK